MSEVSAWFDRKFDFAFPLEHYPNICVRLRGTPARLEDMLNGAPREAMIAKRGDKWSAQEHAGHLLDLEPLWMSRLNNFLSGGDTLTVADLTNRRTHEANHNARPLYEILSEFRSARMGLLDRVGELDREAFARSLLHPRLQQPMRLVDHLFFVAEHDDHHLARVWEMIGKA